MVIVACSITYYLRTSLTWESQVGMVIISIDDLGSGRTPLWYVCVAFGIHFYANLLTSSTSQFIDHSFLLCEELSCIGGVVLDWNPIV